MKTKAEAITKKVTREKYLIALGLFQLASSAQQRCNEFTKELNLALGLPEDDYGHVSDAVYSGGVDSLDAAMKRQYITVEKKPCRTKRK